MLSDYLNFEFDCKGKSIKGFCMKIHDDFHETYAVLIDGYHSFCVWLDASNSTWKSSKYTKIEPSVLEQIIQKLNHQKHNEPSMTS